MELRDLVQADSTIRVLQPGWNNNAGALDQVQLADDYPTVEAAPAGTLVILNSQLSAETRGYRFDLALGATADGLTAVALSGPAQAEPSPTARRVAAKRGIALLSLARDADVAALAVRVRELGLGGSRAALNRLEQVCELVDAHDPDRQSIEQLLDRIGTDLDLRLRIESTATGAWRLPLRVDGVDRFFLTVEQPGLLDPVARSALSYAARRLEELLRREIERTELPEASRGDLVNEILLSDPNTANEAVGRLRRAGFPVDGSHIATCIDAHDPTSTATSAAERYRVQQRIAVDLLAAARGALDAWTRAGTSSSILLVASSRRPHPGQVSQRVETIIAEAASALADVYPDLRLHIGLGTVQSGISGLRNSVSEATSAMRAAQTHEVVNQPHHFDRLGFSRALVRWYELDGVRATIDDLFAPITALGPQRAETMLRTLRAYLDAGQNLSVAADHLHVHRNTVRYRLQRISEALVVDLRNPDDRLLIELGCRAHLAL